MTVIGTLSPRLFKFELGILFIPTCIWPQPTINTVKIDKENVPYVGVLVLYADQGKTKIKEFKKTSDVKEDYLIFSISDKDIKALSAKSLVVKE